jgi:hypothetical protein
MKYALKAAAAAAALMVATPALADIRPVDASAIQGTLVHGTGPAQQDTTVQGQVGIGGPLINFYDALTTDTSNAADADDLIEMQGGQGQADVTGATISGNTYQGITNLDIALASGNFSFIELALMGTGTVVFSLTDDMGTVFTGDAFTWALTGGNQFFGFESYNGQSIANLSFNVTGGSVSDVSQVRVGLSAADNAVPEPGTWAMMLMGFGAAGYSVRRSRRKQGFALKALV